MEADIKISLFYWRSLSAPLLLTKSLINMILIKLPSVKCLGEKKVKSGSGKGETEGLFFAIPNQEVMVIGVLLACY